MSLSMLKDTATFWHQEWDVNTGVRINGKNIRLNFHRFNIVSGWRSYTAKMVTILGWNDTMNIVIVGAGLGQMEENLRTHHGFTNVVSCEDSVWCQAAKAETEESDFAAAIAGVGEDPFSADGITARSKLGDGGTRSRITLLNEDLLTQESRNTVKTALAGRLDVIFTDDIFDRITDADAVNFSVEANKIGTPLVHSVGGLNSSRINAKPVADWKALLPGDTFINWKTGEVF